MLGVYDFFPEIYHGIGRFSHSSSTSVLQKVIVTKLFELNQIETLFQPLEKSTIWIRMEFGAADGITFNYLDEKIMNLWLKHLLSQLTQCFDVFCIVSYYIQNGKKRRPLRFDYYLLRFIFLEKEVEVRIFHERGTQRLSTGDLMKIIMKKVRNDLIEKGLGRLNITYLHTL